MSKKNVKFASVDQQLPSETTSVVKDGEEIGKTEESNLYPPANKRRAEDKSDLILFTNAARRYSQLKTEMEGLLTYRDEDGNTRQRFLCKVCGMFGAKAWKHTDEDEKAGRVLWVNPETMNTEDGFTAHTMDEHCELKLLPAIVGNTEMSASAKLAEALNIKESGKSLMTAAVDAVKAKDDEIAQLKALLAAK